MLLPTELDTAMSPKPFRATMTEVMRSGMEVPAARKVRPITSEGMWAVSPTMLAHHTIRYEYIAIHNIEPRNVTGNKRLPGHKQTYTDYVAKVTNLKTKQLNNKTFQSKAGSYFDACSISPLHIFVLYYIFFM